MGEWLMGLSGGAGADGVENSWEASLTLRVGIWGLAICGARFAARRG